MNNQAAQTMPERALAAWTGKHRTDAENRAFLAGYETCQSDANAAALSQIAGVAEGYVLAPREPTPEMVNAGAMAGLGIFLNKGPPATHRDAGPLEIQAYTAAWNAMLVAAPAASGGEEYRRGYAQGVADVKARPNYDDSGDTKPAPQPPAGASVSERARDELNPPLPRDYHSDGLDRTSAGEPHPHRAATGLKGPDQ